MASTAIRTILAGDETGVPADSPIGRLDLDGRFPFVGALSLRLGARTSVGSAVALSPDWVLTAGHNVDFNDDGSADPGLVVSFHLPGHGNTAVTEFVTQPDFTGFASPALNDDLALLRLASPLSGDLAYPPLGSILGSGEEVVLVGFGRSGFGDLGYSTASSLANRRFGSNVIDQLSPDDEGSGRTEVFRYDFDDSDTVGQADGSLGNAMETIIGPGDSGGPALRETPEGWELVGINTFTQGRGGRFGDTGGGVVIAPYEDWINATTGIPEPGTALVLVVAVINGLLRRMRSVGA